MVSRSTAVDSGRGGGVRRNCKSVGHAARHKPRTTSCTLSWHLLCASGPAGAPLGVPATKHTCTSVLGRCGSCSGLLYVVVLAHDALHASASMARGRTRGRFPWAFDEHLEDPSYSFHAFFLRRWASGGKPLASSRFGLQPRGALRRLSDPASACCAAQIRPLLHPAEKTARSGLAHSVTADC